MQTITGVGVSPGRITGVVRQMPPAISEPAAGQGPTDGATAAGETARTTEAAQTVQARLKDRASAASGDAKAVLEATAMMAADPMLLKAATGKIEAGSSAERAVWEAGAEVAEMLTSLGGYMAERAADVLDVRARVVAELRGVQAPGIPASDTPFVLAATDLAPADTATLDPSVVVALVTASGGPQSHTAILARNLGLPAVVAATGVTDVPDGARLYLDGVSGEVILDPDDTLEDRAAAWARQAATLADFDGVGRLADGHRVPLLANVGTRVDAVAAAAASAEGIGLLRTEFCFLGRDCEPSVAEQTSEYRAVFDAFGGRKVVVRTLDAGADKPLPFLTDTSEPNPALGVRGYRTDRTSEGVLSRQLTAIAAAAAGQDAAGPADVWVMAPMVATAEEARDFTGMCRDAGLASAGVMVEIPAAALTARHILAQTDFASLGTNDLTQYTMAADRQLGTLATLNDAWQPAVLRLIDTTVIGAAAAGDAANEAGESPASKPVGVCGEAAADPALAVVLVGLGVTSLSMSARALPAVSAVLRSVTLEEAQELALLALDAPTAAQAKSAVRSRLPLLDELGL